jgi:septal ring factor EnvC (AmiA/AmiB activator)
MTFRQVQNQRYETALEVRVSILADEIVRLRGFVKELMLVVDHLREKVESVPGEDDKDKEEKEREEKEREEKEREEKKRQEKKKKSKFYSILSMAGIFSVIGAGILWRKM